MGQSFDWKEFRGYQSESRAERLGVKDYELVGNEVRIRCHRKWSDNGMQLVLVLHLPEVCFNAS